MDREQAQLLKDGAAVVALYLKGDKEAGAMFNNLSKSGTPDALLIVALVAEESWAVHTGAALDEMWDELPGPSPTFPAELIDRRLAIFMAKSLRDETLADDDGGQASDGKILLSSLDLALAAVYFLADTTEISGSAWCHSWALAATASLESALGGAE
jgi:hypothetical protein